MNEKNFRSRLKDENLQNFRDQEKKIKLKGQNNF